MKSSYIREVRPRATKPETFEFRSLLWEATGYCVECDQFVTDETACGCEITRPDMPIAIAKSLRPAAAGGR